MVTGASRQFVDELSAQLPAWEREGLLSEGAARALAARYGLPIAPAPGGRALASAPDARRRRALRFAASGVVAVLLALAAALGVPRLADGAFLPLTALAAAFTTAPLVTYGAASQRPAEGMRTLGRYLFYVFAYLLSFPAIAEAARFTNGFLSEGFVAAVPPLLVAAAAGASGHRRTDVDPHARGEAMLLVATCVAFAIGLSLDSGSGTALVATMSLAFLSVGRIVRGLAFLSRPHFLEGIVVAAVLVASRAFDVFPSVWISVAIGVAVLAGAGFAVAGFERRRGRAAAPAAARAV